MRRWTVFPVLAAAVVLAACGSGEATTSTATTASETVAPATSGTPAASETAEARETLSGEAVRAATAENFLDAFYSYDPAALAAVFSEGDSAGTIRFYQGWAEGANYEVLERTCERPGSDVVSCAVTVRDDLALTLSFGFNVTDTFTIGYGSDNEITSVSLSSNDPPELNEAILWSFANRPDVGPACVGFFDDGPTPGDCARAMVSAFGEFAALNQYGPSLS